MSQKDKFKKPDWSCLNELDLIGFAAKVEDKVEYGQNR